MSEGEAVANGTANVPSKPTKRNLFGRPGTGRKKCSSVPDLNRKSDGNRVQEKEKCNLYPICAENWTKNGYRKAKVFVCTRGEPDFDCQSGTGEQKSLPVPLTALR